MIPKNTATTMGSPSGPGGLRRRSPNMVGCLVLDVPGRVLQIGRMAILVLADVFVGGLVGRHLFFCGSGGGGGDGEGWGGGFGGCVSCVLCVV
jgi:hypothetical protein